MIIYFMNQFSLYPPTTYFSSITITPIYICNNLIWSASLKYMLLHIFWCIAYIYVYAFLTAHISFVCNFNNVHCTKFRLTQHWETLEKHIFELKCTEFYYFRYKISFQESIANVCSLFASKLMFVYALLVPKLYKKTYTHLIHTQTMYTWNFHLPWILCKHI